MLHTTIVYYYYYYYRSVSTYVGLYGGDFGSFVSFPTLFTCFLVLTSLHLLSFLLKMFFIIILIIIIIGYTYSISFPHWSNLHVHYVITGVYHKLKGLWIVKPVCLSRGRGISLVNHVSYFLNVDVK